MPALLGPDEWWLGDLARALQMSPMQRRAWVVRGWLHARKSPAQGLWIVWADPEEQARLGHLLPQRHRGANASPASCTTPTPRPPAPADEGSGPWPLAGSPGDRNACSPGWPRMSSGRVG